MLSTVILSVGRQINVKAMQEFATNGEFRCNQTFRKGASARGRRQFCSERRFIWRKNRLPIERHKCDPCTFDRRICIYRSLVVKV